MFPSAGYLAAQAAVARGPLLFSSALSEGQFYSPPESFAGESCWVGSCLGRGAGGGGLRGEPGRLGLFFLFLLSGSLGKASNPFPHTCSPHILALISEPHHLLLSLPPLPAIVICSCFPQGLTMNQMRKSLGRKVSLPRYFTAHLHPTLEMGRCCALPGWTDLPAEEKPWSKCQLVPVCWIICPTTGWSGPLTCPMP